jgi:hypothetical protein
MAHLAVPNGRKSVYTEGMAKTKTSAPDAPMSQYERFKEAARKADATGDPETFKRALTAVAKAPGAKAKKAAKKRKR